MTKATCSASPIIYLYRIGALEWLPELFNEIWMPSCVLDDILQARFIGYDVPSPFDLPWVQYEDPQLTVPAVWLALDLSSGEVAAMSLAFENHDCLVLLDEPMGRRAAGLIGYLWVARRIAQWFPIPPEEALLAAEELPLQSGALTEDEFAAIDAAFGIGLGEMEWLTINALKSAFAPFDERLRLINEVVKPGYAHVRSEQARAV